MRDSLGFDILDAKTIARLAQSVNNTLNAREKALTPEDVSARFNQSQCMAGLDESGVPLRIVQGVTLVAKSEGRELDLDALLIMIRIATRFGTQLQRAIDAHSVTHERTTNPNPKSAAIQKQTEEFGDFTS